MALSARSQSAGRFVCRAVLLSVLPLASLQTSAGPPADSGPAAPQGVARFAHWQTLGPPRETIRIEREGMVPTALATVDLDRDGAPELVVGYGVGNEPGLLVVYPGDPRFALPGVTGDRPASPFLPPLAAVDLPFPPHLLAAGDFDGDGRAEVVVGSRGRSNLQLLRWDRNGTIAASSDIALPDGVTALVAGDFGPADGMDDLLVGLGGSGTGAIVQYPGGPSGISVPARRWLLPSPPVTIATGHFDEQPGMEIAVLAGGRVFLISRASEGNESATPGRSEIRELQFAGSNDPIDAIAAGQFLADSKRRQSLAALSPAGRIESWSSEGGTSPMRQQSFPTRQFPAIAKGSRVIAVNASSHPLDDLLVTDTSAGRLALAIGGPANDSSDEGMMDLDPPGPPVAVLAVRLNADGLDDLVILRQDDPAPSVLLTTAASTFIVNVTADRPDVAPGNGVCRDIVNRCPFRAALQEANALPGADLIQFNLGTGTPTLAFTSALPSITETLTIDGATGGATRIELNGTGLATGLYFPGGFTSSSSDSVLRSLVLNRFGTNGAIVISSQRNRVENCYVGPDASGEGSVPGNGIGVHLLTPDQPFEQFNVIGGTTPSQRNVISHNTVHGVFVELDASGNTIAGNFLGTNAAGTTALPNGTSGVWINADATSNTIGGASVSPGTPPGNVISGNTGTGVVMSGYGGLGNRVQGNLIGTNAAGTAPLGNGLDGIRVEAGGTLAVGGTGSGQGNVVSANGILGPGNGLIVTGASGIEPSKASVYGNRIGTDSSGSMVLPNSGHGVLVTAGATALVGAPPPLPGSCTGGCNRIAGNTGAGIRVDDASSRAVAIRGNSIEDNLMLGVDLGAAGVTPNDPLDADSGSNDLQNFPLLTSTSPAGSSSIVNGILESTPSTSFTVDVYDSATADPSGFGEGARWLGSGTMMTDASGHGTFSLAVPGEPQFLTATATGPGGTSEFSAAAYDPGEPSAAGTMKAQPGAGTLVAITYTPACGATDHAVFLGTGGPDPVFPALSWTQAHCGLGISGTATFDPGTPPPGELFYFVLVGQSGPLEGSYGRDSAGAERPDAIAVGPCDAARILAADCP